MLTQRSRDWKLFQLWIVVLAAFAVALRRSTLVPWGSGTGPGTLGAPLWSLTPLIVVLGITIRITLFRLRRRDPFR